LFNFEENSFPVKVVKYFQNLHAYETFAVAAESHRPSAFSTFAK